MSRVALPIRVQPHAYARIMVSRVRSLPYDLVKSVPALAGKVHKCNQPKLYQYSHPYSYRPLPVSPPSSPGRLTRIRKFPASSLLK